MTSRNVHGMHMSEQDVTRCPVCNSFVRKIYRSGNLDKYEPIIPRFDGWELLQTALPEYDDKTKEQLKKDRRGYKTVALVGLAPTSCSYAPWDDDNVEIWGLNEAHAFPFMKRWDRWYQIHHKDSWMRAIAKRDVKGHAHFLHQEHEDKKIYMQHNFSEVPNSVAYPMHDVIHTIFPNLIRHNQDKLTKYFTSTIGYMMGVAIIEGFTRIEIYGVEMSDPVEYRDQKANLEFFMGYAMASGIKMWLPEDCALMRSQLYGGADQGVGWT